ncbi:DUF6660 family protein [Pontibacter mangrovi]|uniref:DUF2946 domain-containing protein n=1 Tax=Pontibacter mangrovi TaxID=2589816 RepID=A0A501WGB1_9BACT|nr:DUF6660 family protein [Pontibacter mangrovi]TPE46201.1 hypothetical protein FJM65_02320 [Pontibacter mangrovi]
MKHLTVLWAMLILALSCLPCMDGSAAFAEGHATTVQADEHHRDDAQDEDMCTPLCECHCCGGIKVAFHAPFMPVPQVVQLTASPGAYVARSAANPSFPFWHPPRV